MNTKRNIPAPHGVHISTLIWIVLYVIIMATAGIVHTFFSNETIRVSRQTAEVRNHIKMNLNDAQNDQTKINDQLGYFEINNKLELINSSLIPLHHGQVEIIKESSLMKAERDFASNGYFFRR